MIPAGQLDALRTQFDAFARDSRALGLADQQLAEWLLQVSARWLLAHGVSTDNVLKWTAHALGRTGGPVPLMAAARAKNDFGGTR